MGGSQARRRGRGRARVPRRQGVGRRFGPAERFACGSSVAGLRGPQKRRTGPGAQARRRLSTLAALVGAVAIALPAPGCPGWGVVGFFVVCAIF